MGNYKNSTAEKTTITRDVDRLEAQTGNVYKSIAVISKRANQVSSALKEELYNKLQEFATHNDNLEEIFENREQIEISKFYEKLPKPTAIAIQEFEENKVFIKEPENKQ
jgi:DNA-directed RNA polymerase subunit K/omega